MRSLRRLTRPLQFAGTSEGDSVTTIELFFDLVYAFAFTQVTTLMSHEHGAGSMVDGFVVLSLLWWSWCSYSWLANQARADEGFLRVAVIVAMVAIFIACLAVPDAFHNPSHALDAAGVIVACYIVVRLTHASAYLLAAGEDGALRRQVLRTVTISLLPTAVLLIVGVILGGSAQKPIWLGAVLYDFAGVFLTARNIGWVVQSAAHFAERYGLIVILALGESIVAIDSGLGDSHVTWKIVLGAMIAILITVGLYFAYFSQVLERLEHALETAEGSARAALGRDVFTYLHFPIIAGIIFSALGIEHAMAHIHVSRLGAIGGWTLGCGVAIFLLGTVAALLRTGGELLRLRLATAILMIVISPLLVIAPPIASIALVALIIIALAIAEGRPEPHPEP